VACRGSLLRAAPLLTCQPLKSSAVVFICLVHLLDNGRPRICRLEHLDAGVLPLDARLEVLAAPKPTDKEDTLAPSQYCLFSKRRAKSTVTPPVGRLILTDLTWSSIKRRMSVMRGAKMAFRSLLPGSSAGRVLV
jgi:hypothetical protein